MSDKSVNRKDRMFFKSFLKTCGIMCLTLFAVTSSARETPTAYIRSLLTVDSAYAAIDFDEITREALGSHWDEATEAQRQEIKGLLQVLVGRSIEKNIDDLREYPVDFVEEGHDADESFVRLRTVPSRKDTETTEIVFHLGSRDDGYAITDIDVEGISLVEGYRNQFHKVIKKGGMSDLISKMKAKVKKLVPGC